MRRYCKGSSQPGSGQVMRPVKSGDTLPRLYLSATKMGTRQDLGSVRN